MSPAKHIPNFITCLNLLCGCLAIVAISVNSFTLASWLVITGAILDFADGFFARILKAHSPIGLQLDSLADMVTFGLVPGFMFYKLLNNTDDIFILKNQWIGFIPFLITIFSALRLAKFNIDKRQTEGFIGLPTPASTLFVISVPLIISYNHLEHLNFLVHPLFIITSSIILSFLMVSEIPMFSLKFKNFVWSDNKTRYIFIGLTLISIIFLKFSALPLIILIYVVWSSIVYFKTGKTKLPETQYTDQ